MSHYLVTGVAGFIASKVAEFLLAEGHTITGLDNLNDAYDVRLKQWRLQNLVGQAGFSFYQVDICDRPALEKVWTTSGPFEAVINLAARAGVRYSVENPWVYLDTNATGTLNLLELCRHSSTRKFILASTSSLYGSHNPLPYSEAADTNRPLSPYAASKKAAEAMCHSYHHLYNLDVTVVRYFTVYGPAGRPDMSLFRFTQWIAEGRPVTIFGDGSQSRDFTYVDDIARGTIAALKPVGYRIINLGSDRPLGLMDALHLVEKYLGQTAQIIHKPFHPADVLATWADVTTAREVLGWQAQVSYEQGIENLVRWYQANRDWASQIQTD